MTPESAYVPSMSSPAFMTAEQLLGVSIPGKRVELVRGALIVREPAGLRQGRVVATLSRRLMDHVEANGLGQVYAGDTVSPSLAALIPCGLRTLPSFDGIECPIRSPPAIRIWLRTWPSRCCRPTTDREKRWLRSRTG